MESDETGQVDRWRRFVNEVQTLVLPVHGGRLVKSLGDGMLLEFDSVRCAMSAAIDMQRRITAYNGGLPQAASMHLRIGAHVADVVRDSLDIYGTGVNLASRIAGLAGPGEIVISADARDQLVPALEVDIEDLGECYLKHVAAPVRTYRVGAAGSQPVIQGEARILSPQSTIAVIPFTAGDPQQSVLGELLSDGVNAQLSLMAELRVISRLSCSAFAGRAVNLSVIAERLQAHYVLSGSVYAQGDALLVSAELSETRGGSVVWATRLPGTVSELVQAHAQVIDVLAEGVLQAVLRTEVARARTAPLPTLESYSLLLGAVNLMHRQSRTDFERARELLEHLSERHPRHATPKAWMAKWYAVSAAQGWSPNATSGPMIARQHVESALACEPTHSLAWAIRGLLHGYVDADFDAAESDYRHALENNPNESLAWLFLATLHGWRGQGDAAAQAADEALRLSPLDPLKYYFDSLAGAAMLGARRYDRAIELSLRSLRSNRSHLSTFRVLAMAQALSGDVAAARKTIDELLAKDPQFTVDSFLRTSPWRMSADAAQLCDALAEAGVPRH